MNLFKRPWVADALAISLLSVLPSVFFLFPALGWRAFGAGDIGSIFLPFRLELAKALAEGRIPLWSSEPQFGFPLFAEGHVAALYPLNLILFRLLPIHLALNYSILFHLSWAAIGMYVYCRSEHIGVSGAWLAGLIFSSSGFFIAHLQHLTLLAAAAWLPWLIFLQNQCRRERQRGKSTWLVWFSFASLSIGIQLVSGFPQIVLLNLFVFMALAFVAPLLWERTENATAWLNRTLIRNLMVSIVIAGASVILGAVLSAVQWLPAAELLDLSVRAQELGEGFQASFSLESMALSQLVSPFAWMGEPNVLNLEFWLYLGIFPLGLILMAPLLRRDAQTRFYFAFCLFCLSLTLGDLNPIYRLLAYIPLYNRFRVPARFALPFLFGACFLAARGLDQMQSRLRTSSQGNKVAILAGLIVAGALMGIVNIEERASALFWMNTWSILPALFILLAFSLFIAGFRKSLGRFQWTTCVIGLTWLDLALVHIPFAFDLNATIAPSELVQAPLSIQAILDTAQPPSRMFTSIYNETLRPNHPIIYGQSSGQVYSPLSLQRNDDYVAQIAPAMLNLANIRYYFLPSGPLLPEFSEPTNSVMLDLFEQPVNLPPTQVTRLEVISYTDQTINLPDNTLAGELILSTLDKDIVLPIHIGTETADWAYDGWDVGQVSHAKPSAALDFPGYLLSLRRTFVGHKYVSQFNLAGMPRVTRIQARSTLPQGNFTIENVSLVDETGKQTWLTTLAGRNDLSLIFKSHAVTLLENHDALPRAFVVHQAELVPDGQMIERMKQPAFRPDQQVFLSEGQAIALETGGDAISERVAIAEYKPEHVTVKVATNKVGYLVLADTFYPGWEAMIDGKSASIYRADYIFRAVMVPPGEHSIVFEYKPLLVIVGAIASAVGLAICGILAGLGFRGSRRRLSDDYP